MLDTSESTQVSIETSYRRMWIDSHLNNGRLIGFEGLNWTNLCHDENLYVGQFMILSYIEEHNFRLTLFNYYGIHDGGITLSAGNQFLYQLSFNFCLYYSKKNVNV